MKRRTGRMKLYWDLFFTFARIGGLTFGGGMAMLPMLRREVVERKGWSTDEELTDYFAVGQCTPGIIAINVSTFVGYQQAGTLGSIMSTLGMVFPSLVVILLIASFLTQFSHIAWVAHAFAGIRACVCALIFHGVLRLFRSAVRHVPGVVIYCGVLLASAVFGLSPVLLILCAGGLGLAIRYGMDRRKAKKGEEP